MEINGVASSASSATSCGSSSSSATSCIIMMLLLVLRCSLLILISMPSATFRPTKKRLFLRLTVSPRNKGVACLSWEDICGIGVNRNSRFVIQIMMKTRMNYMSYSILLQRYVNRSTLLILLTPLPTNIDRINLTPSHLLTPIVCLASCFAAAKKISASSL